MKLFGNRRRAAHAAPRQKLPRGTRAAIIAVCVVLALTGGVFAAWKLLVKPVQRPSLSQPDPEPVSEPDEAEPSVIHVTPHETEQPEEEPEPDVPTEQPKALTREQKKAWIAQMSGVTVGSDAFFPFGDNVERARKSGVDYIAEPGGSIRDDNVIEVANKYGIAMAFTGMRLFHH